MTDFSDTLFIIYIIFFFVWGAVNGSFVSAIIHRTRIGQSWVMNEKNAPARSACPHCEHVLKWYNLIPIVSWVFQRGRCAYCGVSIPPQYIILEVFSGLCGVALYFWLGFTAHLLFAVFLFPFLLSQAILLVQNKLLSTQLICICLVLTLLYFLSFFLV